MRRRWHNAAAVEWVIYESDAGRGFQTLLVVAAHMDSDGRGAYPAHDRIARLARRSARSVVTDLVQLLDERLLLPGDPSLVDHIRANRRPKVFDLPDAYRLWITRSWGAAVAPHGKPLGCKTRKTGVQNLHPWGAAVAHEYLPKEDPEEARVGAQPPAAPPSAKQPNPADRCALCGNPVDGPYHRNVCRGIQP